MLLVKQILNFINELYFSRKRDKQRIIMIYMHGLEEINGFENFKLELFINALSPSD